MNDRSKFVLLLTVLLIGSANDALADDVGRTRSGASLGVNRDRAATKSEFSSTASSAQVLAGGAPANDLCVDQAPLSTEGSVAFDNTNAGEDGPQHAACEDPALDPFGRITHDIWYCWTSPCDGTVAVQTCGQTAVDTKMAVYDGCDCPATDLTLIACNDDAISCGVQSRVTFGARAGRSYLIRLGTYPGMGTPGDDGANGGTGSFSISCLDPCGSPNSHCQDPDVTNGDNVDQVTFVTADNFSPAMDGTISEVCFWGSYATDVPSQDNFRIVYYDSNGIFPGSVIGGPFFQSNFSLLVTDPLEVNAGMDFPIFEYSADHAPVSVSTGQCYWVEISNASTGQVWFWHYGYGGDGTARQDGLPINGYDAGDIVTHDMNYCFDLPLGDVLTCPPPPNPACLDRPGNCCEEQSTPGCNDVECCERVSACDDFCAAVAWDENCAGDGLVAGCGAAILCPNLPPPCGPVNCPDPTARAPIEWRDPPDGVIDARQPHSVQNAATLQGITELIVAAPPGAGDRQCWSLCETSDGGHGPNDIASVTPNQDGTYTLTLVRPLTPGAVTRASYASDSAGTFTGTFTAHPGNSNADGVVNSLDITGLIDCCLNLVCTPDFGIYSCDIDHSGITSAFDVARIIDLLNGAGEFTIWNASTLPTGPCP